MSLFTRAVDKLERQRNRELKGNIPLIEIIRKWELKFYGCLFPILIIYGFLAIGVYKIAVATHEDLLPIYRKRYGASYIDEGAFGIGFWVLEIIAFISLLVAVIFTLSYMTEQAIIERQAVRNRKLAEKAEVDRQKAAADRATELQTAQVVAGRESQQRALYQFRFQALKMMEDGVLTLRDRLGHRAEFVPEQVDEEHLYSLVRRALAHSRAPELGILRRTFNPEVLAVLGDQSYLPPDPDDAELMRRQLPAFDRLLGKGT